MDQASGCNAGIMLVPQMPTQKKQRCWKRRVKPIRPRRAAQYSVVFSPSRLTIETLRLRTVKMSSTTPRVPIAA